MLSTNSSSAFETTSSSASPTFNQPQEPCYIINSGLVLASKQLLDIYITETERGGAYRHSLALIYQSDSIVDLATTAALLIKELLVEGIKLYNNNSNIKREKCREKQQDQVETKEVRKYTGN